MDYEEDSRIAFISKHEAKELRQHINKQMRYSVVMSLTMGAIGGLIVWATLAYYWFGDLYTLSLSLLRFGGDAS